MRLIQAVVEANHRAAAGDATAGLKVAEFEDSLPVALTCIDVRLNPLLPEVLGIPEEQFIWLRNAGNIITSPMSSTMRSLALACAVKGGREIVIIGHTDCQVAKTSTLQLLEKLKTLGIDRRLLPDNLAEFFGAFSSERQNVLRAVDLARNSPIIGPRVPVHGLLVDILTGRLEWLLNGYEAMDSIASRWNQVVKTAGNTLESLEALTETQIGGVSLQNTKIGERLTETTNWLQEKLSHLEIGEKPEPPPIANVPPPPPGQGTPPRIPLPRPEKPKMSFRTK
jgi:carbonic anhydrase